jgi:hypothetical protein
LYKSFHVQKQKIFTKPKKLFIGGKMKKIITFFTIALSLCFSINSIAQVSSLFFTQSPGAYSELIGGTIVASATATSGVGGLDDVNYPAQVIPFTFTFNGTGYTEYNINSNGYITFGATLPAAGSPYTPISNSAAYSGAISALGRDLWGLFRTTGDRTIDSPVLTNVANFDGVQVGQFITGTGIPGTTSVPTTTIVSFDAAAGTITMSANATTTGAATQITMTSGEIRSETIGAVGSRVHVIQFKRFARFAGANECFNFQIRLYETSNEIEIVYGSNTTLNATSATPQVGLRGATNADFNNRTGTNWSASTAGGTNTATMTLNSTSLPASGQIYHWGPPPPCIINITNLNPTGTIFPGCGTTYAPQVNIVNNGTMNQTSLSVNYIVGSYNETVTGLSLASGANMNVDFPNTLSYTSADAGLKNVTVTVNATCDGGPVSYVLNTSFTVSGTNLSFGGPFAGYYFANSSSSAGCAPSQPGFSWEDTTGSVDLILNGANMVGALLVGSVDDGFFTLGNVLGSNFFRYSGVNYDSFFVGTNGLIAFSRANNTQGQFTTFTPLAIPSTTAPRPAIFPFWKDFNYGDPDVPVNRLSYKVTAGRFIVTYDRAPNFNSTGVDPNDYVSFQVVLEIAPAPSQDGLIIVSFDDAATGSTFLTKYNDATLATHTVGLQNLSGTEALQYRRAVPPTIVVAGPLFGSPLSVAFGPDDTALPVELASFTASVDRRDVHLNWTTASEINNSGFEVEKMAAGTETWSSVTFVQGNGTTTETKNYSFTDRGLNTGSYSYRLKQVDYNGNFEYFNLSSEVNVGVPDKYDLSQNYPNPFNPTTKINFDLPFDSKVTMKIFDITGREIATLVNEVQTAGYYTVTFDARNIASGMYFYRIIAEGGNQQYVMTKKMLMIK